MWTIIKFKKQNLGLFKDDLKKKIGENVKIYQPKILIQKYKNNKLINKEFEILGDYLFCYHENFREKATLNKLKFTIGIKYFLNGFLEYQKDIKEFIEKCKKMENPKGYISHSLFEVNLNSKYKFFTGPFTEKIFKIINFKKNKIDILIGNLKTTINKKKYIFNPI